MSGDTKVEFHLQAWPAKKFKYWLAEECVERLRKWGLDESLKLHRWGFEPNFHPRLREALALKVVQSPEVCDSLAYGVTMVKTQDVPCTIKSMAYFERLRNNNAICYDNGQLRKMLEEYYEDIAIADHLREMLVMETSPNYGLYSPAERQEFIFRLFQHLALGGKLCQYEDCLGPYMDSTRGLYKDLVSVMKVSSTQEILPVTKVFKLEGYDEKGELAFPSSCSHPQDFAYLLVDPYKRLATLLWHNFSDME